MNGAGHFRAAEDNLRCAEGLPPDDERLAGALGCAQAHATLALAAAQAMPTVAKMMGDDAEITAWGRAIGWLGGREPSPAPAEPSSGCVADWPAGDAPTEPAPWEIDLEVRISDEGEKARQLGRAYGRASRTISEQRGTIARLRTERDVARALVAEQASQHGRSLMCECGDDMRPGFQHVAGPGARCIPWAEIADEPRCCARCDDEVSTLSSRDWCDGCEADPRGQTGALAWRWCRTLLHRRYPT